MLPKILTNEIGKMIYLIEGDYKLILPIGEYILHSDFLDNPFLNIIDIYSISEAFIIQTNTHLYILNNTIKKIKIEFTGSVYKVLSNSFIIKENDIYKLYDKYGNNIIFDIPLTKTHWFSGDACIIKEDLSYIFYDSPFSFKKKIPDKIRIQSKLDIPKGDGTSFPIGGLNTDYTYSLSMCNIVSIYSITDGLFLVRTNDSKFHFFDKNIIELSANNKVVDLDMTQYYSLYATMIIQGKYYTYNDNYTFSFNYDPSFINLVTTGHILIVNEEKTVIHNLIPNYPTDGINKQLCLSAAQNIQKIIYANQTIYKQNIRIKNILTFDTLNVLQDNTNNIYLLNLNDTPIDEIQTKMIYNFQPYTEYKLDTVTNIFSVENYMFLDANKDYEYNVITFPNTNVSHSTNFVNWTYSINKAQISHILKKCFTKDDTEYICINKLCNISVSNNEKFFTLLSTFASINSLTYKEIDKILTTLITANADQQVDFVKILSPSNNNSLLILGITFIFVCFLCFR